MTLDQAYQSPRMTSEENQSSSQEDLKAQYKEESSEEQNRTYPSTSSDNLSTGSSKDQTEDITLHNNTHTLPKSPIVQSNSLKDIGMHLSEATKQENTLPLTKTESPTEQKGQEPL